MRYIIVMVLSLLFIGCSTKNPPLKTVDNVDIKKYLGKWYEIARYEHSFEENCKNVNASYTLKEDNKIEVINRCTDITTNEKSKATGIAYATDKTNSKLKVSFFRPFYGDYWILMLADDYSYAVVGSPSREYLWILSRTKKLDENTKNMILEKLPKLGFATKKLIWTIQE
ncbi:MAG: lipocalin family protein [Campylobacterota bacterium]